MTAALAARISGRGLSAQEAALAAGVAAAVFAAMAVARLPGVALVPILALACPLLLTSAPFRSAFVVFGGLAVLQSSQDLSFVKAGYFSGVGIAFVAALLNLRYVASTRSYRLLQPLLGLSLLFALLIGLSLCVALTHGTAATAWLRDALPYFLLASVPVFALDLNSSAPKKWLVAMFVIAGVLASLSYAVEWLDRRSLADLPISRIALPSGQLRTALYVYGLTCALFADKNRAPWTALTALVLSFTWITGNRVDSLLLVSAVPLVAVMAMKHERSVVGPAVRVMTLGGAAAVITVALTQSLATFSDFDVGALSSRYRTIATVSAEPGSDASYQHREDQTQLAWRTFMSQPALGVGPGHIFEWANVNGLPQSTFNIDTGLSFLSKYGLVGLALLLALVVAFASFLRNAGRCSRLATPQLAVVGYAGLAVLAMPFSMPLEDKGFSFGLLLLLALCLPEEREMNGAEPTSSLIPWGGAR